MNDNNEMVIYAKGEAREKVSVTSMMGRDAKILAPVILLFDKGYNKTEEGLPHMGLGLLDENDHPHLFNGGITEGHDIIRLHRAMKILENVQTLDNHTFYACYAAAGEKISKEGPDYIEGLSKQLYPGVVESLTSPVDKKDSSLLSKFVSYVRPPEPIEILRQEILQTSPSDEELIAMLEIALEREDYMIAKELTPYLESGKIAIDQEEHPALNNAINELFLSQEQKRHDLEMHRRFA